MIGVVTRWRFNMSVPTITIPREQIAEFCRRHHIRRLSLFGSVLRDDFRSDSDVDVLVEWEPGHTPGWDIVTIEKKFGTLFGGRQVDMLNPKYINRRLRDEILGTAELIYDKETE